MKFKGSPNSLAFFIREKDEFLEQDFVRWKARINLVSESIVSQR